MKTGWSLKQTWTALILFAVIVPVTIVMVWHSQHVYEEQLNRALTTERHANEILRNKIESEVQRFKTLLNNKSDPLSFLLDRKERPTTLKDIDGLLRNIVDRELAIQEVIILSIQGDVIAAVDTGIGVSGDKLLSAQELRSMGVRWGFDKAFEYPEIVVPSFGRTYLGPSEHHDGIAAFKMAVPIGKPVKAILMALVNIGQLQQLDADEEHGIGIEKTRGYLLGRRGTLLTAIHDSESKPGDIMTHLPLARSALTNDQWPTDLSYIGVVKQPVYGTMTSVPSLNWTLVSEVLVSRVMQPIWESLIKQIFFSLFGIALFVGFVLYLANRTIRPILQAGEAIEHVAKGDYQVVLKPSGISELDTMTAGFNNMARARRDAENLLRTREWDLAMTLDSIGDAVIATDAEGSITRMNPVAEKLTGWSFEEAKNETLKTVFPIVDASSSEAIEDQIKRIFVDGETIHLSDHTKLMAKDGTEYHIADSAAPIRDSDGSIQGMVLVFSDVTEQYQLREAKSEIAQRLADAQHMTHIGNWELDLVNNELMWSDEIFRILEISKENVGVSYESFLTAIHPDDREKVNTAYTDSVKNNTPYRINYRLRMPNGRIKHVHERCKTSYDDAGNPISSTGTVQDITEQVSMEEVISRTQKMDALGELTGGIAHDYNNMLGVVVGYSELLECALSEQPRLEKYAHEIRRAGERGAKLTRKLLAFSRKESTDAEVSNLNAQLQDEQHMLERTLTARIQLNLDLADDLWTTWLDRGDLEDAIVNLSINAMHAMEGNGRLTLQTGNKQLNVVDAKRLGLEPGDYVMLGITDTGCGMDQATKERIFEPFFSTKGEKGTGLGLSQVYGFVDRSKGGIKVYSEPDHGTCFVLYFPRHIESGHGGQSVESHSGSDINGNETILFVDDERALRNLVNEMLGKEGYQVICAQSAKQALDILETESIDLLLSDVIMPEMDGYQLVRVVQEKYPTVKVQLASGFANYHHQELIDEDLHQNLLKKPFNSKILLQRIRALLDEPHSV